MSSNEVISFDTSIDIASSNPGNYQTMKLFFIPAGTLKSNTAVRLLALSHSGSVGDSAFRIRVEDTLFNNLAVEVMADHDTHKIGAYLSSDNNNGLQISLLTFVVIHLNLPHHLQSLHLVTCLSSTKSESKPAHNNGQATSSSPNY